MNDDGDGDGDCVCVCVRTRSWVSEECGCESNRWIIARRITAANKRLRHDVGLLSVEIVCN